jgi:hypothetical protein
MPASQPSRIPTRRAEQALFARSQAPVAEPAFSFDGIPGFEEGRSAAAVVPQGCDTGCCGSIGQFLCLGDLGEPVYAWGTVEATFPSLSIEKEFFQAIDPADAGGFDLSDTVDLWRVNEIARSTSTVYNVLNNPANLFIAREMCWFLAGPDGGRRWALRPRNDLEVAQLVAALAPGQNANKQRQVLIGRRSPVPANPQCNGAPAMTFNRIYPRTAANLVAAILATYPPLAQSQAQVQALVADLLALAPGAGADGQGRAVNYLLLNELDLYYQAYQLRYNTRAPNSNGYELTALQPLVRQGSDGREQVDVVLTYQGNNTGTVSRWYYRVDVAGDFPFVAQGWRRFVVA